jgi:hypothetical protein
MVAMSGESSQMFHLLHIVRIRGRVGTGSVAAAMGVDEPAAASLLHEAADDGHVELHDGRAAGWALTPDGRATHAALLANERQAPRTDELHAAYGAFLTLNDDLKAVCTEWQLRPDGALNDHRDARYDRRVIAALERVDGRAQPVCADLGAARRRFGTYGQRLRCALERVRVGDVEWFTSPAIDSYHTLWFELHEDLLQTLGIARAEGR